jgi:hypothetical protein
MHAMDILSPREEEKKKKRQERVSNGNRAQGIRMGDERFLFTERVKMATDFKTLSDCFPLFGV